MFCIYLTLVDKSLPEIRVSLFLAMIIFIGFLNYPMKKGHVRVNHIPWYDVVLMAAGAGPFLYFAANAQKILLTDVYKRQIVQWAEEHRSYEQKYKEQICFHMCQLFGVRHINCGLMENYPVEQTAQKLKELCQRAGEYMIGVEPVSYTHLDVYKRQVKGGYPSGACGFRLCAGEAGAA